MPGVAAKVLWYGMTLLDHALLAHGLSPLTLAQGMSTEQQQQLLAAVQSAESMLDHFYQQPPKGYIWQIRQGATYVPSAEMIDRSPCILLNLIKSVL